MESGETSMDDTDQWPDESWRAWLSSVTLGDYPGLGGDVTVDLSPRCTVLVGRNGAGKSLILDALQSVQSGPLLGSLIPNRLKCSVRGPAGEEWGYEYERTERRRPARHPTTRDVPRSFLLSERAWKKEGGQPKELWRTDGGLITLCDGQEMRANDGFLSMAFDFQGAPANDAINIVQSLGPVTRISSGAPRGTDTREEIFHRIVAGSHGAEISRDPSQSSRVHELSWSMAFHNMNAFFSDAFSGVEAAARRVGAATSVRLVSYDSAGEKSDESTGVCEVVIDGVNIGLQSDGTLRVLEVLSALHFGPHHLLLEEPETGIHPGLLARLLRELESYEGQVIISTHSPQVVSWAKPEEIRLVERTEGKTTVRSLTPEEIDRVHEYLSHDGTLGEFVYGGALDAEE
jgi:predicted ATPase